MRSGSLIVKGPPWSASLAVLAASIRHSPGRKAGFPPRARQSSAWAVLAAPAITAAPSNVSTKASMVRFLAAVLITSSWGRWGSTDVGSERSLRGEPDSADAIGGQNWATRSRSVFRWSLEFGRSGALRQFYLGRTTLVTGRSRRTAAVASLPKLTATRTRLNASGLLDGFEPVESGPVDCVTNFGGDDRTDDVSRAEDDVPTSRTTFPAANADPADPPNSESTPRGEVRGRARRAEPGGRAPASPASGRRC